MNDKIDDEDHDEFSWEDFAEDREKKTGFLTLKPDKDSFYPAFIACAFMYFLSLLYWYSDVGQYLWVSYRDIFIEQEYWRIVTSVFIHADIKHFLANVPLFFYFCVVVVSVLWCGSFSVLFFCSWFFKSSDCVVFIWPRNKNTWCVWDALWDDCTLGGVVYTL